jgi:hypothetical protein
MARGTMGFFPICILMLGALGLGSCQTFQNSPDSFDGRIPMEEALGTRSSPSSIVPPGMTDGLSRIAALEADNAKLKNQLANALKENAKIKKDLADAIDDKALLKDLAAKKQR